MKHYVLEAGCHTAGLLPKDNPLRSAQNNQEEKFDI